MNETNIKFHNCESKEFRIDGTYTVEVEGEETHFDFTIIYNEYDIAGEDDVHIEWTENAPDGDEIEDEIRKQFKQELPSLLKQAALTQTEYANCQVDSGLSEAKCKKWATLFASTPKMIEALEDAREVLLHYMDAPEWDNKHDSAYKKVCAAIERANRINK